MWPCTTGGGRAQVEHHAGHPVRLQRVAELRVGGAQGRAPGHARVLDREGGDVVVGGEGALPTAVARRRHPYAGHLAPAVHHLPDLGVEHELDAQGARGSVSGVDPGLAGRASYPVDVRVAVHAAAEQAPQDGPR